MLNRYAAVALALLVLAPTALAQSLAEQTAVRYLQDNWNRHGLAQADVAELVVTDEVPGPNDSRIVYLRQAIGGVEVASGPLTVAIDRHGRVVHAAGYLTPQLARVAQKSSASLSPEAAATALARAANVTIDEPFRAVEQKAGAARETVLSSGGVTRIAPRARLVYAQDGGALRLAWETTLYLDDADWFGQIDAATGRVIRRVDALVSESFGHAHAAPVAEAAPQAQPLVPYASRLARDLTAARGGASYRVFAMPVESPLHASSPTPADGRTVVTEPHDPAASPFGWHDTDGVDGAEFTITRGNNTHSYLDRNDDDAPDADGEPDGTSSLTFDFALDFSQGPFASKDASVTNLFYWTNVVHDLMWHYGFDEASGNFQANNYGNGGLGGDAVDAESQDGSGTNNANFSTPADGAEPRMQMYVGTNPTPDVDGSYDNMVIVHEYGHGISIRLTGGPSNVGCLFTFSYPEQMGEGWSDYFGAIMTIEPGDARGDARPVGNYLFGQSINGPGIRNAPYSTDFGVNPYTYGDTNDSGDLSAPHGVGFVWATILWEATWDMIDAFGYDPDLYNAAGTAGNQKMLNLVVTALKLQPCGPGFVDGRDAILAADQLLYGGAHQDLLWAAFARRGLGFGADQGSNTSRSDQVESFVVPEADPPAAVTDLSAIPNGDFITLEFTATGDDGTVGTASEYLVRYASSPILTEDDWSAATPAGVTASPQPSGSAESIVVTGFDFTTTYHVAMKVLDDAFNASDLSNSVSVTTLGPPAVDVATEPILFAAEVGEMDTQSLTIGNTGEGDLRYSLSLSEAPATAAVRAQRYAAGEAARLASAPEPAPSTESKDASSSPGAPQMKDGGGPDGFGYRWIDSNEPGGPTYDWVDISTTGTPVSLSDDDSEQVTLPWNFPFYGVDYGSMEIGSNGTLLFNGRNTTYTNTPIPNTSDPNNFMAVFWDDLNPSTGGQVLYQDMGDGRFIVQWDGVPHYNVPSETMTFQAILYSSGAMLFQYDEFNDDSSNPNSHTIGIENASGTDGLQVVNDAAYLEEGLAIRIASFWGDVTLAGTGRVASGSTETVEITADATGLLPGTYDGVLTIQSNDPATASVEIPLQLVVTDSNAPIASLSATSVTLDVPRGQTASETLTLTNTGASDLDWSIDEASGALPDWLSMDVAGGTLAPGASQDIVITMDPGTNYPAATTEDAMLELSSNDPRGDIEMPMTMNVLPGVSNEDDLDFDGPYVFRALAPNPVEGQATATFAVREPQTVTVEVYDALGRRVALVHEGATPAMTRQTVTLRAADLAAGAYVLVLRGESFTASQRITIAR